MLPEAFIENLNALGLEGLADTLATTRPEVSVRLNQAKGLGPDSLPFQCGEQVVWCKDGYYLPERPIFTSDPLFHQGAYYVQEASSMFHSYLISKLCADSQKPLVLLDACAAPGGKTTAAISALPEGSLVVANEFVPARAAVLRENLIKWSYPGCVVTRGDTKAFSRLPESFDIVMADVPCSGEGMMRKEPEAVAQWSPSLINECAARQWEIVENLWFSLKAGGYFIYSTCTFNRAENEEIVERIIKKFGAESIEIPVDAAWGISRGINTEAACARFIPGRVRGEGLFVALLRKPGEIADSSALGRKSAHRPPKLTSAVEAASAMLVPELRADFDIYTEADRLMAFPKMHRPLLQRLAKVIDVIHEGVHIATIKGRDLIPSQALALSPLLSPEAFPRLEVTRSEALSYLSGEAIELPASTPRGFILLTYRYLPLGFVKNIGRRANNLYPSQWRIRHKFD